MPTKSTRKKKARCWHCDDAEKCRCISCGQNAQAPDGGLCFIAGPCQWCVGRAFVERNRKIFDTFDTLDRTTWLHHPAADGNPVRREWLPLRNAK